ncbi:MAG: hypothetical protein GWP68_02335 [Verrucomicrobiaceae bacterium]|nr:hypothetical protein [Verrucomicrobiaceae bacterium]
MNSDTHITTIIEESMVQAVNGKPISDTEFNTLAMLVFSHQYQKNKPYQNFCNAIGTTPEQVSYWHEIPALPTDAFKADALPLITFPKEDVQKTFLTSGTTTETKGKHHFASTDLYDQSIINAWHELKLPEPANAIFLIPHPEHSPHSSLSHMMGVIAQHITQGSSWATDDSGSLNLEKIINAIKDNQPVALFGTALSYLHLFDLIDSPLQLAPGSWAMETGGYKGTRHQLSKSELYQRFETKLGLPSDCIVNEYSMTELSSQFYSRGLDQAHQGPSWTRTRVIDPLTNTDAKPGELGHLIIYDLANLHSVMAVSTQDLATQDLASQDQTNLEVSAPCFNLIGRDPTALPRGCSRSSDETLSR